MCVSPVPGRHELAGPDPTMVSLRFGFRSDVVTPIAAIGQSPAVSHQPVVEVLAVNAADRHDPTVPVHVALVAGHRTPTDSVGERKCRLPSAAPFAPVPGTGLARLGRIDCVKTDPLAMDLDGIAVDHGRGADKRVLCARRREQEGACEAEGDEIFHAP